VIHQFEEHRCKVLIPALLFVCLSALAACNRFQGSKEPTPATAEVQTSATAATKTSATKRYPLTGRVVSVDKPNKSINIDGEEIPGFMSAMQMPYQVKDATLLDKVAPGTRIKAVIVMANEGAYLENIVTADDPPAKGLAK
jgi:Cu/Ag efflux protein CusF